MKQSTKTKLDERRPEVANDAHKGWTQAALARHLSISRRLSLAIWPGRSGRVVGLSAEQAAVNVAVHNEVAVGQPARRHCTKKVSGTLSLV